MQKLKQKLTEFMRGRYGSDELNRALIILWMILAVINMFVTSKIIYLITLAIAVFAFFRMFSRNIYARQKENAKYKPIEDKAKQKLSLYKRMFAERKTHRYIKCPKCRAVLRVPYKKGKHTTVCPKCGERFDKNII